MNTNNGKWKKPLKIKRTGMHTRLPNWRGIRGNLLNPQQSSKFKLLRSARHQVTAQRLVALTTRLLIHRMPSGHRTGALTTLEQARPVPETAP